MTELKNNQESKGFLERFVKNSYLRIGLLTASIILPFLTLECSGKENTVGIYPKHGNYRYESPLYGTSDPRFSCKGNDSKFKIYENDLFHSKVLEYEINKNSPFFGLSHPSIEIKYSYDTGTFSKDGAIEVIDLCKKAF